MILTCIITHAETYYYTLEKIVTNGDSQKASGSGIFITFTSDGCYDSDSEGYTNYQSYLRLAYKGNYRVYNGDTYWGRGDYKFTSDFSRLNVIVGNKVYVYNRAATPSNIHQSTYVGQGRIWNGNCSNGYYPYIFNICPFGNSYSGNGGMSPMWYQDTYNRYANLAESIYNSITTKLRDYNGNEVSGYVYSPADSQIAINEMKRNLRKVQRDMRDVRHEAARYGYTILKSVYEDIALRTF